MGENAKLRRRQSQFFARSALLMLALVLASFSFTYFAPVASGSKHFPIVFHIHAVAFFAWMLLYAWQTHLVAAGRVARHREWGLAGVALSAAMVPLGVALAIAAARRRMISGDPHPFDTTLFNIIDISTFALLMIASIATVTRHPDWHRRFTFGAALCLLGPALSRWLQVIPNVTPWTDMLPNLAADLFFIALVAQDRRRLGRVHAASWLMIAVLVPVHIATPFVTGSDWWRGTGPGIMALAV
jgi:hypothetical protein